MISFVTFSLRRAWQGFWRNAVMSLAATATMVLMLVLLAGFWIVLAGLNAGLEFVEQKVEIVADVRPERDEPRDRGLTSADGGTARGRAAWSTSAPDEALRRFQERLRSRAART